MLIICVELDAGVDTEDGHEAGGNGAYMMGLQLRWHACWRYYAKARPTNAL